MNLEADTVAPYREVQRSNAMPAESPSGQVELSSFYQHAWRLNDGSFVLTNDVSFQLGGDLAVDGRQLPVQPQRLAHLSSH